MAISINISRLKNHLSYLQQEQDEVMKLVNILRDWECETMGENEPFFLRTRKRLEKQRDMINRRLAVLECLIEEFSMCIYTIENNLEESNSMLDQLVYKM